MIPDKPQPQVSVIEEGVYEDIIARKHKKLEECRKVLRQNTVDDEKYQTNQTDKIDKKSE